MKIYIAIRKWKIEKQNLQLAVAFVNEHDRNEWIMKSKKNDAIKVKYETLEAETCFDKTPLSYNTVETKIWK